MECGGWALQASLPVPLRDCVVADTRLSAVRVTITITITISHSKCHDDVMCTYDLIVQCGSRYTSYSCTDYTEVYMLDAYILHDYSRTEISSIQL